MLNLKDANSAENNPVSPYPVVTPLWCSLPNARAGGPKGSGTDRVELVPGSMLESIYAASNCEEPYFCNYGVNEKCAPLFEASGLRVSARGTQGETRAVELADHPFFIAMLFQPQLSSRPDRPHPIWLAFLRAANVERSHFEFVP